jgi:hypothetical protein
LSQIRFGIVIPQGWRNDLPQISSADQYQYSKDIVITAKEMVLIQFMLMTILFHTIDILVRETFLNASLCYLLFLHIQRK